MREKPLPCKTAMPATHFLPCQTGRDGAADDTATDEELLAAVVAGERHAFTVLYRRHAPWLAARLRCRCADASQVDDVLQDTFVAAWLAASAWDGRGPIPAWLWGIAFRRLVDSRRRQPAGTRSLSELPESQTPRSPSAEEQALIAVALGPLGWALQRLGPDLRVALEVTVLQGLTTREASRVLAIPVGTVKTRTMRARAVLRAQLAAEVSDAHRTEQRA
jgi:RNA polymerase sigma-70 factor, ECF subfamily